MEPEYKNWLELAKSDLLTANMILKNKEILPSISIYHSHQCVEKALKAILIKKEEPIPKVHNLSFLLQKATTHYQELKKYEDACAELNSFLPKLRYPIDDQLTSAEAKLCQNIAKEIYHILLKLIESGL